MVLSIPIAWLQLTRQRVRFLVTLAGVAFVAILLFMQLGFQDALYESAVKVHRSLQGDIFLISPQYASLTSQQSFPRERLYQALALDEVESVNSLYLQFGKLRNIKTGEKNSLFVFGVDPAKPIFTISEINDQLDELKISDRALFDRASRPEFGPIAETFDRDQSVNIEISPFNELTFSKALEVRGLFTLGPSFGVDGNLIVPYLTFGEMFLERTPEKIDVGVITLKPGKNIQDTLKKLKAALPNDVRMYDLDGYSQLEKEYWAERTPIGFTFTLMVTMGFIVGVVIVYQILYSNIANHLIEFATIKAIGYSNHYLFMAVFQQAVILATLGFIPGFAISLGLFDLAKNATHLPVVMTPHQAISVLTSIFTMCLISGAIAVNKLRSADPADIF
ncbi:ABC transporter permease DevC [Phormidesmis priestleyi]